MTRRAQRLVNGALAGMAAAILVCLAQSTLPSVPVAIGTILLFSNIGALLAGAYNAVQYGRGER